MTRSATASSGKRIYDKCSCFSCHGDSGVGIADLRQAAQHYPTPEQLKAWTKNAPGIKSNTKMPAWEGVVGEEEYEPLMAYVLALGTPRSD